MDYKDLANLIFPDAKPIEFYEEKYPERDLPEGAMVVRIGPSQTGSVHIGTIYQALLARTIADKTNGVFFMRVEDTDQKREVENGIKDKFRQGKVSLIKGMDGGCGKWLILHLAINQVVQILRQMGTRTTRYLAICY